MLSLPFGEKNALVNSPGGLPAAFSCSGAGDCLQFADTRRGQRIQQITDISPLAQLDLRYLALCDMPRLVRVTCPAPALEDVLALGLDITVTAKRSRLLPMPQKYRSPPLMPEGSVLIANRLTASSEAASCRPPGGNRPCPPG